ncbi:MAG: hypothetical protein JO197_06910 [Acidobacteria bacterium]|nr:hypothetical protein [Acidobacteriota bacterium]MBV9477584.1 hypothetical protein [Acidobacteriota bacterium]
MARIDPERAQLVVRLVYDGPAQAGKTTSLRALAQSLGTQIFSAAEEDGRTLYFDWVDYVGGLFEGMPIRCQIVSAPGQTVLENRRRMLLATADAVVFVVDSLPERMPDNRRSYAILREIASQQRVAVGIVIQANKRDLRDAISLDDLRDAFGSGLSLAMTEAVAERGEGVRETFVLAIRLALDRVRALWADGLLDARAPEVESGDQLLAMIVEEERKTSGVVFDVEGETAVTPHVTEHVASDESSPRPPDASIPPGLVWPPVQGRVIVHEAARHTISIARDDAGTWRGVSTTGGWQISSPAAASFPDLEQGREALIAWARWHVAATSRLSPERAIVLAPSVAGEWRLWQIVRASRTLRDLCREAVRMRGRAAGEKLFEIIDLRAQANEVLVESGIAGRVTLEVIAQSANGAPVYAGGADYPPPAQPVRAEHDAAFVEHELLASLRDELAAAPDRLSDLLASIESAAALRGRTDTALRLRRGLLNT